MKHCRSAFATATVHPASTVPPAACSPAFHASVFLFLPILTLVIDFILVLFFGNFIYTEHLYKPQSVQTQINLEIENEGRQFPRSFPLPFSFIFFPFSRLPNTPLRMTTQRMVG